MKNVLKRRRWCIATAKQATRSYIARVCRRLFSTWGKNLTRRGACGVTHKGRNFVTPGEGGKDTRAHRCRHSHAQAFRQLRQYASHFLCCFSHKTVEDITQARRLRP